MENLNTVESHPTADPKTIISIILLCLTGIVLIAFQLKLYGWIIFGLGLVSLLFLKKNTAKDLLLIYPSLGILGLMNISTDLDTFNFFQMGAGVILALAIPFIITRYIYKEKTITYPWHHKGSWTKLEFSYVALTLIIAYFLLPFCMRSSGAYMNWSMDKNMGDFLKLFIGTQGVGFWDELFFVVTVFGIFKKYLKFHWANLAQAVIFSSFLYELGFTGWSIIVIFIFALLQGLIYRKTTSIIYIITIHLSLDLILLFVLVNLLQPDWLNIFIT